MLAFHASFDATEWTFMDFGYFYDFWPFLGFKNRVFGRKCPFFQIFGFLLLSASASLWFQFIVWCRNTKQIGVSGSGVLHFGAVPENFLI